MDRKKQAQKNRVVTVTGQDSIVVGDKQEPIKIVDYAGLPYRGELETFEAYKIRRKQEALELKMKQSGKLVHLSKYVHEDPKARADGKKHYFIDGKGTYRKDK